jgi:ribosomal protein S18 acetylase RimI-like enzyme
VVGDIEEILRLRGVMFDAIGIRDEKDEWIHASRAILESGLAEGSILGAVVERGREAGLCAGGLLHVHAMLGSPRFPRGAFGYIGSIAVDPPWRRQGLGEAIVTFLVSEARELGLERVELHATPDGERIYRRLGFGERDGGTELRLVI